MLIPSAVVVSSSIVVVSGAAAAAPLTVFAPTDEAFAAVPQETLDALGEDPELLRSILLYHVVDGEVTSDQVEDGASAATLAGPEVQFSVKLPPS